MSKQQEGNVLLGALLDRMGKTQGQALLARLEQWLSGLDGGGRESARFDESQYRDIGTPYDRRKGDGNGTQHSDSNSASSTPKDW